MSKFEIGDIVVFEEGLNCFWFGRLLGIKSDMAQLGASEDVISVHIDKLRPTELQVGTRVAYYNHSRVRNYGSIAGIASGFSKLLVRTEGGYESASPGDISIVSESERGRVHAAKFGEISSKEGATADTASPGSAVKSSELLGDLIGSISNKEDEPKDTMYGSGRPRLDLLPLEGLEEEARGFEAGLKKYAENDWRTNKDLSQRDMLRAAISHIYHALSGIETDAHSGKSHLAHAKARLAMAITMRKNNTGKKDY